MAQRHKRPTYRQRDVKQEDINELVMSGLHPVMARVLASRGIKSAKNIELRLSNLIPISKMKNAVEMATMIADAIEQKKKMVVVADYDSDGATSCTVAVRAIRAMGGDIQYLVPNRFEHGYGLQPSIVDLVLPMGVDYIITVDNGIASVEGVRYANEKGLKVLVTDHHLPGDVTPAAECIVNPNQHGCEFPSKNLAGCGVIFYVMAALERIMKTRGHTFPNFNVSTLLDFVALGTVADVVKLDDNNRILVSAGLQLMRDGKAHPGIKKLIEVSAREEKKASVWDMGFSLGPRLNAAGRLDDMSVGINCLLSDDLDTAEKFAGQLHKLNKERREIEAGMQEQALDNIDTLGINPDNQFTVTLFHESWHQGVIGILASRIKEKYNRPVITFAKGNEGELKGSGRSIPPLHLRDALDVVYKRNPGMIVKFGGHAMAAGLTIKESEYDKFCSEFDKAVSEMITKDMLEEIVEHDGRLHAEEVTPALIHSINNMIWGQGFLEPVFYGIFHVENQKLIGNDKHSKLRLSQNGQVFDAILFNHADILPDFIESTYTLGINEWQGREYIQLNIQNFNPAPGLTFDNKQDFETVDGMSI